ncbi:hypothetical protein DD595_25200, partial [Enterobacter cloacae complex sp. 4DZ3-17B2]|uniref:hAT family dimerization domain-containing protein n=1 Tax=Enterobacter cloacae complex sp. 4DZ3-17B2 TaxID=2511990 RepID=UPI00102750CC
FDEYTNAPRETRDCNILKWWKENQQKYPTLALMARDILGTPATSVPAERLFSKASLIIRKHRNRLNAKSARTLLCMNGWLTCNMKEKLNCTL